MISKLKRKIYKLFHPLVGEVWAFHRVTEEESKTESIQKYFTISPMRLEQLIQDHLQKGYRFVSVGQVQRMIETLNYPYKFIAITLDDGYADNYEIAYPIFKKYNIPFCIFISESIIKEGYLGFKMLTEEQIVEISKDELCTIGSHTISHANLSGLSTQEQKEQIEGCKLWLEQLIKQPVISFAYPYGDCSPKTIEILQSIGVNIAFVGWGGGIRKNNKYSTLEVPRIVVTETKKL